jgi:hypothetical protein
MLTEVVVRNSQGTSISFPLDDIEEGYSLQSIDGLDPVKATIVSSSAANMDGEVYQASRREKRNIVLKLGIEPDFVNSTARSLRNRLYAYFMPKSNVKLTFLDDTDPDVEISGYVESLDSPQFAQEPEASISILCMNSDFVDPKIVTVTGNSVADQTEKSVIYPGTIETGIVFRLFINRALSSFSVFNRTPDGLLQKMDVNSTFQAGDVVEIVTTPGSKRVTLIRGNGTSSILYAFAPYSSWLQLFPGQNYLRVAIDGAVIPYSVEYTAKYGGL